MNSWKDITRSLRKFVSSANTTEYWRLGSYLDQRLETRGKDTFSTLVLFNRRKRSPITLEKLLVGNAFANFLSFGPRTFRTLPPIVNTFISVRLSNENTTMEATASMNSQFSLRDDFLPQFRRKGLQPVHLFIQSSHEHPAGEEETAPQGRSCSQEEISHDDVSPQSSLRSLSQHWLVLARGMKGIKSLKVDS